MTRSRQRLYATLLAAGAVVLLARTAIMLISGALGVLVAWVAALLLIEFVLDLSWLVASIRWWLTTSLEHAGLALRLAGTAIVLHGIRVLIFVLGRTGPWTDFDVRPEQRILHGDRWTWGEVYFAATAAALGVVGVLVIYLVRRHRHRPAER